MSLNFLKASEFTERAENIKCLVVGDIILDRYIYGSVSRISPEAPIPVLGVTGQKQVLGGAANVAGNIIGFGICCSLCGVIGADESGKTVKRLLSEKGIEFVGFEEEDRVTSVKTRVVGMNQQLVRIDDEQTGEIREETERELLQRLKPQLSSFAVVVISDYSKGVCSESFCTKLIDVCNKKNVRVIVDPKKRDFSCYSGAFLITPNFKEFKAALGEEIRNSEEDIVPAAYLLLDRYRLDQILITRSQYGMTLVRRDRTETFRAIEQEVYDVSGAGDTVIAAIAAFLSAGYELSEAVEASAYAAGLSVSKPGTYTVTLQEVIHYINHLGVWYRDKLVDEKSLEELLKSWRKTDERVVFTNGCFDILHIGHIDYLNQARRLGTKLIVAVNTDASVRKLKGEGRPINEELDRAYALAALQCVDAVILFDEDTPEELICKVRPDVLVKGGDYRIEEIVGRQYASEVITIPLTEGRSTTGLIERIRSNGK